MLDCQERESGYARQPSRSTGFYQRVAKAEVTKMRKREQEQDRVRVPGPRNKARKLGQVPNETELCIVTRSEASEIS